MKWWSPEYQPSSTPLQRGDSSSSTAACSPAPTRIEVEAGEVTSPRTASIRISPAGASTLNTPGEALRGGVEDGGSLERIDGVEIEGRLVDENALLAARKGRSGRLTSRLHGRERRRVSSHRETSAGGNRVRRPRVEDGKLVALEVDVVVEAGDLRIPVGPLREERCAKREPEERKHLRTPGGRRLRRP